MTDTMCRDEKYSTTRLVIKEQLEIANNQENKFNTVSFLPIGEGQKCEDGLRTKGYFKKPCDNKPLVSVITVVLNGEKYLEKTIQSVVNQTYPNLEYIIIDGGSTDSTLDIIKKYDDKITKWISQKDNGISDAFNKGIKLANGEYINFQGDGDGFVFDDVVQRVFENINPNKDIIISARIQRIDENDNEIYKTQYIKKFHKSSLLFKMSLPHQGLFVHKSYFDKYGLFDLNNKFCMDYELLLRSYHKFPKVVTKNIIVARWRADGLGNNKELDIFKEYDKIKRDNKVANKFILDIINFWILFKFKIKKLYRIQ